LRILMVTAELAPLAKVGGLADVAASLSAALAARGHDVRVVLPLYGDVETKALGVRPVSGAPAFTARVGQTVRAGRLHEAAGLATGYRVYLVENDALFGRLGIYTGPDGLPFADGLARTVLHCQAALTLPTLLNWTPGVLHCHDAEAALAAVYHKHWYRTVPGMQQAGSLLTIHNLAYQELHPRRTMELVGLPPEWAQYPGIFEYHDQINLLKAGILEAGLVNTVSPTYAREVLVDPDLGCGLSGVLGERDGDFCGILNGADLETWDPARDPDLPTVYDAADPTGKARCRTELARELGLSPADGPLAGMVGRLVEQKGLEVLLPALDSLIAEGWSLAVLGTGQETYERALAAAAARHPGRVAFAGRFDDGLAHRIMAGSDVYLMPSRYEPCGLTQMYAMRYGTVPVVHRTGGLADTVRDAAKAQGNGFVFESFTPGALRVAMARARDAFRDGEAWGRLVRRGMNADFSWDRSAAAYEELYRRLAASRKGQP